jgi:putative transcriptional regulator
MTAMKRGDVVVVAAAGDHGKLRPAVIVQTDVFPAEHASVRYRPGRDPKPTGKTDWRRVQAMSDEEVEANAASDPDNLPLTDDQLAQAFRPADIRAIRETFNLSQAGFAKRFGLNLRTLQDWEQGRREPDQIVRLYLKVVAHAPDTVTAALANR